MADDLSLLFKLRADNAQAKASLADTRAAISQLRNSFGTDLNQMQAVSAKAFGQIQGNLNNFIGRLPGGNVFVSLTDGLRNVTAQSDKVTPALSKFNKTVDDLSKTTGKSTGEITKFLGEFVKLPNAADRGVAGYIAFGSKFDQLQPKLEAAGKEMALVASETAATGASFAAIAGPVGIAVLAIGSLAFGTIALGKALFGLAEQAADFRGKLFDLSQQTGVSVETLSALEIVAKTTGGSIEGITASLGIFQKKLEEAQDPASKTAKTFEELGVATDNTEQALRDALTQLAKMPVGFHQTATALELFGRGGKQILAILKEMDGDLDGAIEKFRELGLVVSTEDAKAADEFNDQLAILNFQIRGLLGREVIPAALSALKDLSAVLKNNRETINLLGQALGVLATVFGGTLKVALDRINLTALVFNTTLEIQARLAERIARALGLIKPIDFLGNARDAATAAQVIAATTFQQKPGSGGESGLLATAEHQPARADAKKKSGLTEAQRDAQAQLEILRTASQDAQRIAQFESEALRINFAQRKLTLEEYTQAVIDLAAKEAAARQKVTNAEREEAKLLPSRQQAVELAKIRLREQQNHDDFALAVAHARQEQQRQIDASDLALNKQLADIQNARREGELNRLKDALDRGLIIESVAIEERQRIEKEAFDERMVLLDFEASQTTTAAARLIEIDNKRLESQQRFTDEFKRLTDERMDALAKEQLAALQAEQTRGTPLSDDQIAQSAGAAADAVAGLPPALDDFNLRQAAVTAGIQTMSEAFYGLGQAVGQVVEAFVLYGSAGTSVRKVTAQILAGIAQQAAIKAVFELAEGFAALALAFFGVPNAGPSASAHFAAAAIYGGIAGIAAVAGRGVAGGAFAQAGGGSSGSDRSGPSQQLNPLDLERSGSRAQTLQLQFHIESNDAHVLKVVAANLQTGGELREMVNNDGVFTR